MIRQAKKLSPHPLARARARTRPPAGRWAPCRPHGRPTPFPPTSEASQVVNADANDQRPPSGGHTGPAVVLIHGFGEKPATLVADAHRPSPKDPSTPCRRCRPAGGMGLFLAPRRWPTTKWTQAG